MSDFYSLIARRYELLKEVGRGGMGVVYLATQRDLNRVVALKVVPPAYLENPVARDRFRREIQIMRKLNHPGVVTIYDVEDLPDGSSVIVMEYMKGRSLEDVRLEGPTKDWKKVALWGARAADALHHAHQQGVVHRDIKPGNIMLLDDGRIKVMDFGIAKSEGAQNLTMDRIIGTPAYMSPEQALGKTVDHRADIYSLGVSLYAMLAGHSPFDRDGNSHSLEVIQRQINDTPDFLSDKVEGLPQRLVGLIHQMISKSPLDRPVDADDVKKKLDDLLQNKAKSDFFLSLLATEIGGVPERLKRDRLKPTDFVMLELVLPGLSRVLTHQIGLGLFLVVLSASAFFTPFPITLSIVFRVVTACWTFFSLKGADTKATMNYLWFYQRVPFIFFSLLLVGGLGGAFMHEMNVSFGEKSEAPSLVNATRKNDVVDADFGAGISKKDDKTPVIDKGDYGLGKVEPTATPLPTPESTASPVAPKETAAVEVASVSTPAPPTPLPTARPTATRRGPSALDIVNDRGGLASAKTSAPTPAITMTPSTIKPINELSLPELVADAGTSIKNKDIARIEEILTVLNGEKKDAGNAYLAVRFLLTSALDWLDQRAYMRHVRDGWITYDDDFNALKAKIAADKSPDTQLGLVSLILAESFTVTINMTKRRGLPDFVDPDYGQDLVTAALKSDDRDRQFAALVLMKNRNKPELTPIIVEMLAINIDNKAVYDAFHEEALSWVENYGSKEAIPVLEERVKRSDVMLGEKRRLQEAIVKIQKRSGG